MKMIFVDGYNIINSWPELINEKKVNYEAARQKLIDILQNYVSFSGCKVILVFDAHLLRGSIQKKERMGNLIVVFTKEGETADSYIERSVNDVGRKVDVSVVTNDNLEQQIIFQRGAIRKSSLDFYHEVLKANNKIKKSTEKNMVKNRNLLEDLIEENVLQKLEKIRRNR